MFRGPTKYSEYIQDVPKSIDYILKRVNAVTVADLQAVTNAGATTTLPINTGGITSDYFQLDTTATPTLAPGMFAWNDAYGTADLRLKGNNVTLQVGQETLARVVNKTGSDLLESQYKVVRVRIASEGGAQGQRLAVVLAQGNNDPDSATTLGIVTEDIPNNQEGFITIFGNVNNINTTGSLQGETWVDGDVLYLSPTIPGAITKVKPVAPQHTVIIGYVVYAHNNNGKIFVKVDNGYELDELHNVLITSPANNDLLQYNSTQQVWKNIPVGTAVPTPTLAQVTTAGNTTTNAITVGKTTVIHTPSNGDYIFRAESTQNRLELIHPGSGGATLQMTSTLNSGYTKEFIMTGKFKISTEYFGNAVYFGNSSTTYTIFTNTNNFAIGTTTDAGYKLDVNGTVRVSGTTYFGNTNNQIQLDKRGGTTSSSYLTLLQDGNNRTFTFYQRASVFGAGVDVGMEIGAGFLTLPYYQALIGASTTTSNAKLIVTGSITAATALAQGVYFNNTLVAAANNDVLVGLDINPTFTNGAFTGVENVGLRIGNAGFVIGSGYGYGALYGYANDGIIQVKTAASYNTQLWFRPAGNASGYNSSYWSRIENDGGNFKVIAGNYGTLGLYTNNAGGSGANIILTGVIGAANNSLTINGAQNAGRIALTTFGSSPITLNGGNILIGTTTDAGYKLDVNGSARIQGNTILLGTLNMGNGSFSYSANPNDQFTITGNQGLILNHGNGNSAGAGGNIILGSSTSPNFTVSLSNIVRNGVAISRPVTLISGSSNVEFNSLLIDNSINYTNATSSIARGLYIAPTLTSVSNFRAIETTVGKVIHQGLTNATHTNQVYYNTTTGELTYGALPTPATPTLDQVVTAGNSVSNNGITITKTSGATLTLNPGPSDNAIVINNSGFIKFTGAGVDSFIRGNSTVFSVLDAGFVSKVQFHWGGSASYINTGGNFLIGTTTDAGYKLDVNGSARVGSLGLYGNNGTITAPLIRFNGSNQVNVDPQGYGTVTNHFLTTGNYIFSSGGGIRSNDRFGAKAGTSVVSTPFMSYGISRPDNDASINALAGMGGVHDGASGWYQGLGLVFYTSNGPDISGGGYLTEKMRLSSVGNLGLGTSNPTAKLQIKGTGDSSVWVTTDDFNTGSNTGSVVRVGTRSSTGNTQGWIDVLNSGVSSYGNLILTGFGGNVLIGTTIDSGFKLDVVGADSRFNGVRVGLGAGGVGSNTVVGNGALNANTSGYENTAIGYQSSYSLTGGLSNTAVGYQSLYLSTVGEANTAIGWYALRANTSDYITAVGYQALKSNTFGQSNTAVGANALEANTSGQNNTSVGWFSLQSNTTGSQNTALGSAALNVNSTGISNTAVGYIALEIVSTGSQNTAIGVQAGKSITTASNNTIIGSSALRNSTGSDNTAIGYQAGYYGVANTTGTNNIFIGNLSTGVSATESNRTWIGNSSTTSTWLAGNVLIGTTTDNGNKLNVNGDVSAQAYKVNNVLGFTGIFNVPTNPPGQQNIDIQGGIVINIF